MAQGRVDNMSGGIDIKKPGASIADVALNTTHRLNYAMQLLTITDQASMTIDMGSKYNTHAIGTISQDSVIADMANQVRGGKLTYELTADGSVRLFTLNAAYDIGGASKVLSFAANEKKKMVFESNGTVATVEVIHGAA